MDPRTSPLCPLSSPPFLLVQLGLGFLHANSLQLRLQPYHLDCLIPVIATLYLVKVKGSFPLKDSNRLNPHCMELTPLQRIGLGYDTSSGRTDPLPSMQPSGGGGHIGTVTNPLKKQMVDHLQRTAEDHLLDRFYICQPRPPLHKRYSHEPAELGVYAMGFRWSSSISRTTCHDGGYSCLLLDSHVPLPPIAHPQVLCPICTVLMYAFLSVKRANANWTPSLNLQRLRLRSPSSARPAFVAAFGVRWRRTRLLPTKCPLRAPVLIYLLQFELSLSALWVFFARKVNRRTCSELNDLRVVFICQLKWEQRDAAGTL